MVDCSQSCASTPTVGFGSAGGLGYGGLSYGYGEIERAANLGILAGVVPSCIGQIPPAEVVVQPPSCIVTIPGPILSASCEPVAIGGNIPSVVGGPGLVGSYGLLGDTDGRLGQLRRFGSGSRFLEGNMLVATLDEPIII